MSFDNHLKGSIGVDDTNRSTVGVGNKGIYIGT